MARRALGTKGKPGRPSKFTEELAERICLEIAAGHGLRAICEATGMPDPATVYRWLEARPEFASRYARARERQADVMDEKILAIAEGCTAETAAADRVRLLAYQWRAAKLRPKVYGDRVQAEHSGPDGGPLQVSWVEPGDSDR